MDGYNGSQKAGQGGGRRVSQSEDCVFTVRFGVRFPCMSDAYSKDLRQLALNISSELGCSDFVREGVYCMVSGPNFETIAEARMLQVLGCDAVGEL